jgi:hypothetical protein
VGRARLVARVEPVDPLLDGPVGADDQDRHAGGDDEDPRLHRAPGAQPRRGVGRQRAKRADGGHGDSVGAARESGDGTPLGDR